MKILIGLWYVLLTISTAVMCDFTFNFIYDVSPNIITVFGFPKYVIAIITYPFKIYLGYNIANYFIDKHKNYTL
jgi:hypothetical protein